MHADNYHQVLVALDRALDVFAESSGQLAADDYQLKHQIELIRSKILKAESGIPFPFKGSSAFAPGAAPDPDLTKIPWST
jgi:hypothetical protein